MGGGSKGGSQNLQGGFFPSGPQMNFGGLPLWDMGGDLSGGMLGAQMPMLSAGSLFQQPPPQAGASQAGQKSLWDGILGDRRGYSGSGGGGSGSSGGSKSGGNNRGGYGSSRS
jgi:hypothetical protein